MSISSDLVSATKSEAWQRPGDIGCGLYPNQITLKKQLLHQAARAFEPGHGDGAAEQELVANDDNDLALMWRIDGVVDHLAVPRRAADDCDAAVEGHAINRNRVRRLMRKMGITTLGPKPLLSKRCRATRSVAIERPNQVWRGDITYIPIGRSFLYPRSDHRLRELAALSWRLSNTMVPSADRGAEKGPRGAMEEGLQVRQLLGNCPNCGGPESGVFRRIALMLFMN